MCTGRQSRSSPRSGASRLAGGTQKTRATGQFASTVLRCVISRDGGCKLWSVNPYFYEANVVVGESLSDYPSVGREYFPTFERIIGTSPTLPAKRSPHLIVVIIRRHQTL